MSGPDSAWAREKYRRVAAGYERRLPRAARALRRRAVERLAPAPGDLIIDVGCGTGLSFAPIERAIGPEGRLIGVELSPEMAAEAQRRVDAQGWRNVTVINAPADEAELPAGADGALFVLTHDIMRSASALRNVIGALRPGARVAVAGAKRPPRWLFPLAAYTQRRTRPYVTTFEGFERPWSHLAVLIPDLDVAPVLAGAAYVAWGTKPGHGS